LDDHDAEPPEFVYRSAVVASASALRWVQRAALLAAWSGGAASCGEGSDDCACAEDPPRGPYVAWFADATAGSGIAFRYAATDFRGGALAIADLDGDGLPEIVAGRRTGGLALFANGGELRFREVAGSGLDPEAEVGAIAAADLDNDGDRDLVIAGPGTALVMANRGDATFEEVARFDDSGHTEHVLAADLDGDGLLDLYFGNYSLTSRTATLNRLYMNRGGLVFAYAGTVGNGLTWTTTAVDVDADGDQDLYVANDTLLADFGRPGAAPPMSSMPPDLLLRNDGPGADGVPRFTNVAATMGLGTPRSSMGGVLGDLDDDGLVDLYVPDYGANKLFVRDPAAGYVDRAPPLGIEATLRENSRCPPGVDNELCLLLSWSAALGDFDLDGRDELVVASGETEPRRPPPVVVLTRGADPAFHEVSTDLGCQDARAMIAADLDGDGDQDLAIAHKDGPLKLFETRGRPAAGAWLRVLLHGRASNRDGVGAVVTARLAGGRQVPRVVGAGGVIHSSGPAEAFFGLGRGAGMEREAIDVLEVQWPSGRRTEVARPLAGATLIVEED
jgi:hypothetical protein